MNPYWSYLLTAVGVFGLYLAGRKDRRGWMVGIGAQVLWIAYAVSTHQWGFLISAGAYGWVYVKNARSWKPSRAPYRATEVYVFDLMDSVMNGVPLDFHGHAVPADVQAVLKAIDGPWHPVCRYCGADCSEGRSWDGGDLYACPRCAELRAAAHRAHSHRIEGRGRCAPNCVHPSHRRGIPAGRDRFA